MDWRALRQALTCEPAITGRRVVSVGDEVGLGNPSDEDRRRAEPQGNGPGEGLGSLIACRDGMTRGDGPGKLVNNEGEVRWAPENALEISEAATGAPFAVLKLEVVGCAAHHDVRDRWRVHDL